MIISFIRSIVLYISIVTAMRILGKRQMGELQPSELVVSIIISDLASVPMQDPNIPLINGLIPIATLMICEVSLSFIMLKSKRMRTIIAGNPSILIRNGIIIEKELERLRFNLDDLLEELRAKNYPDIRDIDIAILENTGVLNIIPRVNKRAVIVEDLGLTPKQDVIPHTIIADGKLMSKTLEDTKHDLKWLRQELTKQGIRDVKHVLFASVDDEGNLFVQKKEGK